MTKTTRKGPPKYYTIDDLHRKVLWAAAMNVLFVVEHPHGSVVSLGDQNVTRECLWLSSRGLLTFRSFEITDYGRTHL